MIYKLMSESKKMSTEFTQLSEHWAPLTSVQAVRAVPSLAQDRPDHDNWGGWAQEDCKTQTRIDTTANSHSEPEYLKVKSFCLNILPNPTLNNPRKVKIYFLTL